MPTIRRDILQDKSNQSIDDFNRGQGTARFESRLEVSIDPMRSKMSEDPMSILANSQVKSSLQANCMLYKYVCWL